MSKSYFEMTEIERELIYLGQTVEYAGTRFAEGLGGIYKSLSTREVISIQSEISNHLFEASSLIGKLLKDSSKLEDDDDERGDFPADNEILKSVITYNTVCSADEIKEIKDCKVYHIEDIENKEENFYGTEIVLFNEQTGKYINLLKDDDGELSKSQWY